MLKLSRMIDYGVVVLSQLANRREMLSTAPELADATGLPAPMVSKVLKALARSDLVVSHRGVRGGYSLSRGAAEISVAEIVEALEGPVALTACVEASDDHCRVENVCPIRGGWEMVNDAIRDALEAVSLADLIFSRFDDLPVVKAEPSPEARGQV